MIDPSPSDAIARLRAAWLLDLPERGGEILSALETLARTGDEAARTQARSLSHRLKGTAGAFGLLAVGGAAGEIEEALLAPGPCPPDAVQALRELLSAALLREKDGGVQTGLDGALRPRILFVGGDAGLLRQLTDLARARSWEVDATLGPSEALQAAAAAWPDAVLLAVEDDSVDESSSLAARLRSLRPGAELPVAACARHGGGKTEAAIASAAKADVANTGLSLVLEGPLEQARLRDAIVSLLARR